MMTGYGMGFGIIGWLLMLVFWGALIAFVVWLVRSIFPGTGRNTYSQRDLNSEALEILNQRYARGEINREQYEQMKQDIQ